MALRTTESLQKLFQLTKERQQKKKEKERKLKLQAWKENYKQITKKANKALQDEIDKRMEYLSTLAPKRSENVRKQSQIKFSIYHSNLVERELDDRDLYNTRKELQQWEQENWKCINWEAWDRVSQQCKKRLGTQ